MLILGAYGSKFLLKDVGCEQRLLPQHTLLGAERTTANSIGEGAANQVTEAAELYFEITLLTLVINTIASSSRRFTFILSEWL